MIALYLIETERNETVTLHFHRSGAGYIQEVWIHRKI